VPGRIQSGRIRITSPFLGKGSPSVASLGVDRLHPGLASAVPTGDHGDEEHQRQQPARNWTRSPRPSLVPVMTVD
jgi:hypothetical protein